MAEISSILKKKNGAAPRSRSDPTNGEIHNESDSSSSMSARAFIYDQHLKALMQGGRKNAAALASHAQREGTDGRNSIEISLDGNSLLFPEHEYSSIDGSSIAASNSAPVVSFHDLKICTTSPTATHTTLSPHLSANGNRGGNFADQPDDDDCCSCPKWIAKAPLHLKCLIVFALALFVGSVSLVGLAIFYLLSDTDNDEVNPNLNQQSFRTAAPVTIAIPSNPSTAPVSSSSPSLPSLPAVVLGSWRFYATADQFENTRDLKIQLSNLPTLNDAFFVHLGGWNSPVDGDIQCPASNYESIFGLYESAPVPVLFVVGETEYSQCPQPTTALSLWRAYLSDFHNKQVTNFDHRWEYSSYVDHQGRSENFVWKQDGITFVGINLPGPFIFDQAEWEKLIIANLDWIHLQWQQSSETAVLVILAHGSPRSPELQEFYDELFHRIETFYKTNHFVLVHSNLGEESFNIVPQFEGRANLDVITVEGSRWPPMQVELNVSTDRVGKPIVSVGIDQFNWYIDHLGLP